MVKNGNKFTFCLEKCVPILTLKAKGQSGDVKLKICAGVSDMLQMF